MTSSSSIRILFAATALAMASGAVFAQAKGSLNLTNSGTLTGNMSTDGVRSYKPTSTSTQGTTTTTGGQTPGASTNTVGTSSSTGVDSSIGTSTGSGSNSSDSGSSSTTVGGGSGSSGSGSSSGGLTTTNSNGLGDFVGPPDLSGLNTAIGTTSCLPGMSDCGGSTGVIGSVIGSTGVNTGTSGITNGLDLATLIQIGAPIIGAVTGNQTAAQIGSVIGSGASLYQSGSLIPNENWSASQWANLANIGVQVGAAANKDNSNWQTAANVATAGTTLLNGYNALNNRQQSQLVQVGVSSTGQPVYQQTTTGGAYTGQTVYNTTTGVAQNVLLSGQTPGINGSSSVYTAGTQYVSNQVGQVAGNAASGLYSNTSLGGLLGTVGNAGSQYVTNQVGQLTGNSTLSNLVGSGVRTVTNQVGQTYKPTPKPLLIDVGDTPYTPTPKPLLIDVGDTPYTPTPKPLLIDVGDTPYTKPLRVDGGSTTNSAISEWLTN